jgi:hypothetical protein
MKEIKSKNDRFTLTVLNDSEAANDREITDSNSISQERLRQSRIKFNLATTLIVVSATFCFTGIGLFWSGKISQEAAINTVDLVSRVVTSYCLPLIKSARGQLNELAEELEDD